MRGSITREATVWCGCGCDCQQWDQEISPRPTEEWRARGWRQLWDERERFMVWHCPHCAKGLCGRWGTG